MAWKVPNGCHYAVRLYDFDQQGYIWNYYSAGHSIKSDAISPLTLGTNFILTDFTNGYIYTTEDAFEITCNGNEFTVTHFDIPFLNSTTVHVIASDDALDWYGISVIGDLTFGDGTNLKNKADICNANGCYGLIYSFHGRTDITTISLPVGVDRLYNAFAGCTNLQTVYGSVESAEDLNSCFMGCSSLTTLPTFATSAPDDSGLDMARCFEGCTSLVTPPNIPENTSSLYRCFYGCTSLTTAPSIPSTGYIPIEDDPDEPSIYGGLSQCFYGCTSLTTVPALPNLNVGLHQTFYGCTSLVTAPTIPSNITSMIQTFYGCTSLTGEVEINTNIPTEQQYLDLFTGTVNDIMLSGSSQLINSIASQYNNVYIWSLSSTLTAQRNEQSPTSINISVNVSRFNTGTLSSLNLYRDNSSTPLSVTWNDPTLSIDSIPETFTTTLANISESDTLTLTVIATDSYGSSQASSVKIPISFYTMDVQAGGKEIAFGGLANDDVSDYPEGLFECNMSFKLKDNLFWIGTRSEYEQAVADDKMPEHTIVFITDETADYVVEEGTSGIWTYRKWNSGVSECWCITTPTSIAASTWAAWGNIYEAKITDVINYPTNLFTSFPTVMASATPRSTAGVMGIETSATGDASHTPYFYALRPNKPTATMTVSASIHAIGTWK